VGVAAAITVVAGDGAATVSAKAPAQLSPTALLLALAKTPFPRAELPPGYTAAKIDPKGSDLSVGGPPNEAKLRVEYVVANGSSTPGLIWYLEFADPAHARSALAHPNLISGNVHLTAHNVPGCGSVPGLTFRLTVTGPNGAGKTVTDRFAGALVVQGKVVVEAVTANGSGSNPELPLLKSAVVHLRAAEKARS